MNDSVIGSSKKDNKIPLHDFQTHIEKLNSASAAGSDSYGQLINLQAAIVVLMKYLHLKKLYNRYEEFETKNHQVSIT